ncbi:MAG: FtsX-like permease family protein [Gemmatimonadetes bacterium]|nr:FtsX-like permease family protein [Gemmatimonadota bacterium]
MRLALGAAPGSLVRLVMGDAFRLVLLGIVAGLVGAVAAGRALASQLYEVKPADPAILLGSALVLGVLTVVASLLPARRAARTDPMTALRSE